jgi:MFS family permease
MTPTYIGLFLPAPLSEFFGRTPIYIIGYFVYTAFSFLVAFGNLPGLLIGRFLQGVAGSAFLSVVGGSVTDMWIGTKVGKVGSLCQLREAKYPH